MFVAPSTDLEFLHIFAEQIGLKRKWFQNHTNIPHYDLTRSKRTLAVQYGAVQVDQRETVAFIKLWRQHRNDLGPQQVNRIK